MKNPFEFANDEQPFGLPDFSGALYAEVNGNIPFFHGEKPLPHGYEMYSPLDSLGRCGVAEANLHKDHTTTETRESLSMVKPTGWHSVKYTKEDGTEWYFYHRSHLIRYKLMGENANALNLVTGTESMNERGMLPFEDKLLNYVLATGNHVRYRVTPIFKGNELVARGLLLEAESVEDEGKGIMFNVYCYNVQPGYEIDYATGEHRKL